MKYRDIFCCAYNRKANPKKKSWKWRTRGKIYQGEHQILATTESHTFLGQLNTCVIAASKLPAHKHEDRTQVREELFPFVMVNGDMQTVNWGLSSIWEKCFE